MSRIGIGIDFGTSNSAAALYDGEQVALVDLEPSPAATPRTGADAATTPSATYIDRELRTCTGREAIRRYVAGNTGRRVELVPEVIGKAMLAVGHAAESARQPGQTLMTDVYGEPSTDASLQGRLFCGVKRLLGRADAKRLVVFDQPFRPVALITPILLRIRRAAQAHAAAVAKGRARTVSAGHPVNFEGRDRHRNQLALSRLGEAYRHAGILQPRFHPEPIAAAESFLAANPQADGEHLLCVDFGGGTLDLCVLRREAQSDGAVRVLATHGIGLGGDHIDQRLFEALLFPLLGKGERWHRPGEYADIETAFPFQQFEPLLLNWAITYLLNQNRYTGPVQDCIARGGAARDKFQRLRALIQQNAGYLVFQAIKDFKAELSLHDAAVLDIPEIDVEVTLTRTEFETLIADMLAEIEQAVEHTLQLAKLPPSAIDIVLRTGGSSLIPAVHRLLDGVCPGRVVDHDPFMSVAAGLAISDYRRADA